MTKENSDCSVLILLSGGIDSTALVQYHISQGEKVEAVFFDYGQKSCKQEFLSAKNISDYYDIKLHHKELGFKLCDNNGEYYCRNGLLVLAGCSFLKKPTSLISIGIHSGSPFYDSSPSFIRNTQTILDGYFGGITRLIAPFLDYSKSQVYEYAIQNQVPFQLTYSCESGQVYPCGRCPSCIDRRLLCESKLCENSNHKKNRL
ncbi:7-cyano-7-deazaguanine synthase [Bacillus sp. USDA818B3_A]|uniref:7-cyano-7-deazaguanine synthase n=1 Tax=Bacillus sp. USDA818B3_A TaxID=2698834 RepID=UPI00136ACB45|nr:7-cyano-7-deazaguanine synthase [Bacillus sp. USDA818B3_A]